MKNSLSIGGHVNEGETAQQQGEQSAAAAAAGSSAAFHFMSTRNVEMLSYYCNQQYPYLLNRDKAAELPAQQVPQGHTLQ
jgi:hypothetical protein